MDSVLRYRNVHLVRMVCCDQGLQRKRSVAHDMVLLRAGGAQLQHG